MKIEFFSASFVHYFLLGISFFFSLSLLFCPIDWSFVITIRFSFTGNLLWHWWVMADWSGRVEIMRWNKPSTNRGDPWNHSPFVRLNMLFCNQNSDLFRYWITSSGEYVKCLKLTSPKSKFVVSFLKSAFSKVNFRNLTYSPLERYTSHLPALPPPTIYRILAHKPHWSIMCLLIKFTAFCSIIIWSICWNCCLDKLNNGHALWPKLCIDHCSENIR